MPKMLKNEEDDDVYNAALILYAMSRSDKVVGSFKLTTRIRGRIALIASPKIYVDDDNVGNVDVDEELQSSTTSTNTVKEQPRANHEVNEEPPPDNQEVGGRPPTIPPVPMIMNVIGACSPPFVKQLTKSDLTDGQRRLKLGKEFVNGHLVPMFNANENMKVGIEVTAYNGEGRQYDMTFKLWASKLYVLMKGWKAFYKRNNLTKVGEHVTVWMFRHVETQKLCFVITQGMIEGP